MFQLIRKQCFSIVPNLVECFTYVSLRIRILHAKLHILPTGKAWGQQHSGHMVNMFVHAYLRLDVLNLLLWVKELALFDLNHGSCMKSIGPRGGLQISRIEDLA